MANQIVVSDKKWGYISVFTATILYGIWNTFSKILLQDLNPLALSALVYCIAGIFLFAVRFSGFNNKLMGMLDSKSEAETHMSRKDYLVLIITSLAGSVIAPVVYLTGLNQITAVSASLLLNSEVLFIIIIGILVLNERFQKKEGIGLIFLATNGNLHEFSVSENLGTLLVIVAAFFWSIDTTMSKFLSNKRDLLGVSALKCSIGGIILLILSLMLGLNLKIPLDHLPYLLFIGLVSIGFSFVMIYYAIRKIGSLRTGSIFPFTSLFGAFIAFIVLGEPFTYEELAFGLLMLLGVFIIYRYQKK